jgi:hypothetical protein
VQRTANAADSLFKPQDDIVMHELLISNLVFHALATLALVAVAAATSLPDMWRRRTPRTYVVMLSMPASVARHHVAPDGEEQRAEAA